MTKILYEGEKDECTISSIFSISIWGFSSAVKKEEDGRDCAFIFFLLQSTGESSPSCLHYLSAVFWFLSLQELVRHSFVSPKTLLLCFLTFFLIVLFYFIQLLMCVLCTFGTFSHLVVLSEGAVHLASQGHHSFALETPQTKHHRFNHKEVFISLYQRPVS